MNKRNRKILAGGLSFSLLAFLGSVSVAFAQSASDYVPLTTVPGLFTAGVKTNPVTVIKGLYGLAIGAGAVIAVIMIIVAGFKYMYEESISGKSGAKEQIQNAFLGLFVILGSYILLRTINADLVNFNPTLLGGTGRVAGLVVESKLAEFKAKVAELNKSQKAVEELRQKAVDISDQLYQSNVDWETFGCPSQVAEQTAECVDIQKKYDDLAAKKSVIDSSYESAQISQQKNLGKFSGGEGVEATFVTAAANLITKDGSGKIKMEDLLKGTSQSYQDAIKKVDERITTINNISSTNPAIIAEKNAAIKDLQDQKKYLDAASVYFRPTAANGRNVTEGQPVYSGELGSISNINSIIESRTANYQKNLLAAGLSPDFVEAAVKKDKELILDAYSTYKPVQKLCDATTKKTYPQLCP